MDKDNNKIAEVDMDEDRGDWTEHELDPTERIIGFYG
jgi:hypothetical protein